jgi:hypothetical protein
MANDPASNSASKVSEPTHFAKWSLLILGILTALAGALKVYFGRAKENPVDEMTLKFFATAAVIILVRELLPMLGSFTSIKVASVFELERKVNETEQKVDETQKQLDKVHPQVVEANANASAATSAITMGVGKKPIKAVIGGTRRTEGAPVNEDDPQKGKWGGEPVRGGRNLSATVKPLPGDNDFFRVRLEVTSIDESKPLTGKVYFHLHDTFDDPDPVVNVKNGKAVLNLVSYGAFTAGAEADNGQTKLELDLAKLEDAPQKFKEN